MSRELNKKKYSMMCQSISELSQENIDRIKDLHEDGVKREKIAEMFGLKKAHIKIILNDGKFNGTKSYYDEII